MKIILLGKMGAGKDTVADYLCKEYGFVGFAFAGKVKEVARDLFPDAFVAGKPRELLQSVGQKMREIQKECWTHYVMRQVEKLSPGTKVVITDCRYLNELHIAQSYGFKPIVVECMEELRIERLIARDGSFNPATLKHISETELDQLDTDMSTIFNDGSRGRLFSLVDWVIEMIKKDINTEETPLCK